MTEPRGRKIKQTMAATIVCSAAPVEAWEIPGLYFMSTEAAMAMMVVCSAGTVEA